MRREAIVLLGAAACTSVLAHSNLVQAGSTSLSSALPCAGISLIIDGGNYVGDVKEEVKAIIENTDDEIIECDIDFTKDLIEPKEASESAKNQIAKEVEEDFYNLVIAQVDSYVNVRDYPDEHTGKKIGKLYDKSVGNLIETTDNGWYKIESGNCIGYVKAEYCVTGTRAIDLAKEVGTLMATVNTTTLKVRMGPGTDSGVLGLIPYGEELVVTEDLDGWVGVTILEGDGYVSKEYVNLKTEFVKAESKEEEEIRLAKEKAERDKANAAARAAVLASAGKNISINGQDEDAIAASMAKNPVTNVGGSGMGSQVANFALQFVGNPYVYGGVSLTNGADCSGFVLAVYANFGVSLPHSATADRSVGYDPGGMANAQPGDLICYSGHVGIYIGNGQIVHASTPSKGIIVGSAYYSTPLAVRRIF